MDHRTTAAFGGLLWDQAHDIVPLEKLVGDGGR